MNFEKINEHLTQLYLAINSGAYVFPEFSNLSKKKAKEYSLKAHSVILRLLRVWEETNAEDI